MFQTVGTHAKLEECCKTVLPKKRKRHMQTKHSWAFSKSRRRKFPKMSSMKAATSAPEQMIFIDLEHVSHETEQDHSPGGSEAPGGCEINLISSY